MQWNNSAFESDHVGKQTQGRQKNIWRRGTKRVLKTYRLTRSKVEMIGKPLSVAFGLGGEFIGVHSLIDLKNKLPSMYILFDS